MGQRETAEVIKWKEASLASVEGFPGPYLLTVPGAPCGRAGKREALRQENGPNIPLRLVVVGPGCLSSGNVIIVGSLAWRRICAREG